MKKLLVTLASVAALATVAPAQAATVVVAFGLSAGKPAPTGTLCPVGVPSGADGVVVLQAALTKGCIVDYHTTATSFGRFVDRINHVSGPVPGDPMALTYWALSVDGAYTDYGVDSYRAKAGDEVVFSYTTWATCLTPAGC